MVGVFVRVERDGRWQNCDFDELSDEEMLAFLRTKSPAWVRGLAVILGAWVRDNVIAEETLGPVWPQH